jgi:hypothetical protein
LRAKWAAFHARLTSRRRSFRVRSWVAAGQYDDLLGTFGDDYFALECHFEYDPPLVSYRYGGALAGPLRELLDGIGEHGRQLAGAQTDSFPATGQHPRDS